MRNELKCSISTCSGCSNLPNTPNAPVCIFFLDTKYPQHQLQYNYLLGYL